jgi:hypothetical protein
MPKALAAAEGQEEFYAQEADVDIVTDGVTWHPITIPAHKQCRRLVLQCQKAVPVFDVDVDMASFRVSAKDTGPGGQFGPQGVSLPLAFAPTPVATTVRYVLAPAGYKIYVGLIY